MSKNDKARSRHLKLVRLDTHEETVEEVKAREAATKTATAWFKRLRGLQEPATRINRLYLGIQEHTEELGLFFEFLVAHLEKSGYRTIYLDFVRLLSGAQPIHYAIREKLYLQARARNQPLLRVLTLQSQIETGTDEPHPSLIADFASLDPELHEISLGRRKALARTANLDMVQRLSRDPDPRVIRILLDHPKLTEKEVIKIASRRPASSLALAEVIHHMRWGTRMSAQEAIALNPNSPPGLAAALLPLLPINIRRQLREGLNAHPLVLAISLALDGDNSKLNALLDS